MYFFFEKRKADHQSFHFAPLYLIFLAELSKPAFRVSQILLKTKPLNLYKHLEGFLQSFSFSILQSCIRKYTVLPSIKYQVENPQAFTNILGSYYLYLLAKEQTKYLLHWGTCTSSILIIFTWHCRILVLHRFVTYMGTWIQQ